MACEVPLLPKLRQARVAHARLNNAEAEHVGIARGSKAPPHLAEEVGACPASKEAEPEVVVDWRDPVVRHRESPAPEGDDPAPARRRHCCGFHDARLSEGAVRALRRGELEEPATREDFSQVRTGGSAKSMG